MKNTQGKEITFNLSEHSASIQEVIDSDTSLNGTVSTWNLSALDSINVIDSINDDKHRKEIEFKRKRKNNVITWAVIGSILDASSGDDSILDGVLLGGLFGLASSGSPKDPEASILLTFTNGDKLGLIVNKTELLKLMEVPQQENLIDGKTVRILSNTEQNQVIESRRSNEFTNQLVMIMLGMVAIGFFNWVFGDDIKELNHGALLLSLGNIGSMIVFSLYIMYLSGFFGKKTDEYFKKPSEK
ncbi:MAG: hypothetical protein L0G48_02715 [Staphylococcus equorum]|nr:hypothetical protein [Chryseobacterium sp.]MDN5487426.1 hypothetical protein [Lactococcus lactis]MDN5637035.1 hypothetical protein [Staphylococcus equorum]